MSFNYRVSELRSTISRLRSSFRGADFEEAEQKLLSMEQNVESSLLNLREERDFFESELSGSRLEEAKLKEDLSKLERECEINDRNVSDLGRELSLAREKEAAANKRYGVLFEQVRAIEVEEVKLIEEKQREQALIAHKMSMLNCELDDLKRNLREKEVENEEIRAKNGTLEKKIEEGKRENDAHLEKIVDLEKTIGVLEMKTSEFLKQTEGRGEEMEKKVLELERTVATWVSNGPMGKVLANAEVEKIITCLAMKVITSRGIGVKAERVLDVIEIESDDDDDDELSLHEVKKRSLEKRGESECEGSTEDSLNPKIKLKKLSDLDRATITKCNENLREGRTGTPTFSSHGVQDLLATCRRRKTINID